MFVKLFVAQDFSGFQHADCLVFGGLTFGKLGYADVMRRTSNLASWNWRETNSKMIYNLNEQNIFGMGLWSL